MEPTPLTRHFAVIGSKKPWSTLQTQETPPRPNHPAPKAPIPWDIDVFGWLHKRGAKRVVKGVADWKKRWFRRRAGEDTITYGIDDAKMKGQIFLTSVKRWFPNGALVLNGRGFEIVTEKENKVRVYTIYADNDEEYNKWTTFLTSYLKEKGIIKSGVTITLGSCVDAPSKRLAVSIIHNKTGLHSSTRKAQNDTVPSKENNTVEWNEEFFMDDLSLTDTIRFKLYNYDKRLGKYARLGMTDIKVKDLIARPKRKLVLAKPNYDPLVNEKNGKVTFLKVSIKEDMFPKDWPIPQKKQKIGGDPNRRIMIISRGTQGDVQPFVALARGLAEYEGFDVILCTELTFRDFVRSNAQVKKGSIRFRPSGGDTSSTIDSTLSQWAIQQRSTVLQAAIIARAEAEFFSSHFLIHYWTEKLKPTCFIYGFTMATVTMIMSEKHKIPAFGFIFQPTCIPSQNYSPVVAISTHKILTETLTSQKTQENLKHLMETLPVSENINSIRKYYTDKKLPADFNIWKSLTERNFPLVVPIKAGCFGGKPDDWPENARLTDFIFLRKGPTGELTQKFVDFINDAKSRKRPIVVIGFSSMPVPRTTILEIVISLVEECDRHPAVIALVGNRDFSQEKVPSNVEEQAQKLKNYGLILEEKGAPFGRLFPLMDAIIVHGGLGTTAEALRVGVPVIVTGVLLMDQRFWGKRVQDLGVGPSPIHILDFPGKCVKVVNEALEEEGPWKCKAGYVAKELFGDEEESDGVLVNVKEFMGFMEKKEKFIWSF